MAAAVSPPSRVYEPHGAAKEALYAHEPEVLLAGPAGTGKTRGALEKLNICAWKYPRMRGLILRKTRASLNETALVTWEQKVLPEGWERQTPFHHGDQEYKYPNGSIVAVAGLDKTSKVMSSEWDQIYVQEAIELTENEWETLTTRLRNNVIPYQQLIGDTNPDAPMHWIKQRGNRGQLVLLESRHEDNPTVTPEYLSKLDALTGVRYKRLRLGLWVAAEGQVYEAWDPAVHLVNRFEIPAEWPRYLAIDFGFTNPFVAQWWAVDPDGRMYRYREIYRTQMLVEDAAALIKRLIERERAQLVKTLPEDATEREIANLATPKLVVCDHDAEGRATLERHTGLRTTAAQKEVTVGIQEVQARLRPAGDGRPRLFYMRDSLVDRDPNLDERKLPCCSEEEIESYVWDTRANRRQGEEPLKENDHGMDATRYITMAFVKRRTLVAY